MQEVVEKRLVVGGKHTPHKLLEKLGTLVVLSSVLPYLPNSALLL